MRIEECAEEDVSKLTRIPLQDAGAFLKHRNMIPTSDSEFGSRMEEQYGNHKEII